MFALLMPLSPCPLARLVGGWLWGGRLHLDNMAWGELVAGCGAPVLEGCLVAGSGAVVYSVCGGLVDTLIGGRLWSCYVEGC